MAQLPLPILCCLFASLPAKHPLSTLFYLKNYLKPFSAFQVQLGEEVSIPGLARNLTASPRKHRVSLVLYVPSLLLQQRRVLKHFVLFVCFFSPADFSPRDPGNDSQLHVSLRDLKQSDGAPRGGPLAGVHRFRSVRTVWRRRETGRGGWPGVEMLNRQWKRLWLGKGIIPFLVRILSQPA